jgi:hypothetical protein
VVHIVVAGYIVDHYYFMFDRGVVHIVVAGYVVDHYCLRFDRGVVHIVVAGNIVTSNGKQYNSHNNMNHSSVKHETVMVNNITSYNNLSSYCCGCYIVDHYSLMFDRGVVHIVVAGNIADH